jgi:hypothetical protein
LTFSYADSTVVLGPLSPERSAAGMDLCLSHCDQVTVPRGWSLLRLPLEEPGAVVQPGYDLRALADAVRAAAGIPPTGAEPQPAPLPPTIVTLAERRHLRVVADADRQRPRTRVVG